MATQTRPFLMTGAALASATAIVAATPAIMPSMAAPAPLALSAAQAEVQLATFSDLLSITPEDWNYYFFDGWGQAIRLVIRTASRHPPTAPAMEPMMAARVMALVS